MPKTKVVDDSVPGDREQPGGKTSFVGTVSPETGQSFFEDNRSKVFGGAIIFNTITDEMENLRHILVIQPGEDLGRTVKLPIIPFRNEDDKQSDRNNPIIPIIYTKIPKKYRIIKNLYDILVQTGVQLQ